MSSGVTSPSPYPGTFALDAAARFGFSGGPVFVMAPDGGLQLAGIIRGAQVNRIQYVTPPSNALPGQPLSPDDLKELKAEESNTIECGVAYAVDADVIGTFLSAAMPLLDTKGFRLAERFLPKH